LPRENRNGGKIKKHDRRPLRLAHRFVEGLPALLKGEKVALADQEAVNVRHALLRGHVSARHEARFKERFVQQEQDRSIVLSVASKSWAVSSGSDPMT
jgi:hypothetical protein